MFFFLGSRADCQELVPLGTWRTHIAYNRATRIVPAGERTYCVTENGLFYFDRSDNSLGTLSKVNGLSDVIITAMGYEPGTLVLGYDDGNLDIIKGTDILNFTGIRDAPLNYSKIIHDVRISGNRAYLATEYGIIVFDLDRYDILETWRDLGTNATTWAVSSMTILNDTLYAGTTGGVIAGPLKPGINLVDYNNWKHYASGDGINPGPSSWVVTYNSQVMAVVADRYLYSIRGNKGYLVRDFDPDPIVSLSASSKNISIVKNNGLDLLDDKFSITPVNQPLVLQPRYCITGSDGSLFIADGMNGMVTNGSGDFRSLFPDGPFFNQVNSVNFVNDKIIILPSGYNIAGQPLRNNSGFCAFTGGKWENYNNSGARSTKPGPPALDLVSVSYNPVSGATVIASYGYGLITWNGDKTFSVIDENTPGSILYNSNPQGRNTLITATFADGSGKIYLINKFANNPLVSLSGTANWKSYPVPDFTVSSAVQILKASTGLIWLRADPAEDEGILVYDENTGKSRALSSAKNEGGLPGDAVYGIAEDLDGIIWVATDKGVAYFPETDPVMDDPELNAIVPIFDNRYLLRGEKINCLAVDGGNNKWVGTDKGAWLFNDDGSRLLASFDASNSPLFSDRIVDIGIDDQTGEVFFNTDKGLLSYRATATKVAEELKTVKIFPNPVPPGFSGLVGITGLPFQASVKITDTTGKLVYETVSQGGTASWNGLDPSGKRIATGIYLVFTATPDGKESLVGKLAVIQ